MSYSNALHNYQQVQSDSARDASPHQLITKLFDGLLQRLASARGHMERNEIADKGQCLGSSISIIGGLRGSIDHNAGGDIARNLDDLYEYCERRLLAANLDNEIGAIDEVMGLIKDVRHAWIDIPAEDSRQPLAIAATGS
ncbi:MAG: flagellar export chaperone FliS [Gammaproteobacteria bacterium]